MFGLKVMDTFTFDDVEPKDSGEAQVAKGALLGSSPSGCIASVSATYEPVLGIGQFES